MKPGDLLLYESTGKWYERIIALTTHGPFVHSSIVVDDHHVIEARPSGIAYAPMPQWGDTYTSVPVGIYATPDGIARGLAWAKQQQWNEYGWADILYQGIKFLWPNNPLQFSVRGHFDCSDFCARYLIHAGVQLPDSYLDTATVTPNDLARVFGFLPPRKGHPHEVVQSNLTKEQL